ncbi:MAG: hypothetical protein Q8M29_02210 [Bacteroidota bacterium]|nr:hypothetical protein [Bacteroidota bacterium]
MTKEKTSEIELIIDDLIYEGIPKNYNLLLSIIWELATEVMPYKENEEAITTLRNLHMHLEGYEAAEEKQRRAAFDYVKTNLLDVLQSIKTTN